MPQLRRISARDAHDLFLERWRDLTTPYRVREDAFAELERRRTQRPGTLTDEEFERIVPELIALKLAAQAKDGTLRSERELDVRAQAAVEALSARIERQAIRDRKPSASRDGKVEERWPGSRLGGTSDSATLLEALKVIREGDAAGFLADVLKASRSDRAQHIIATLVEDLRRFPTVEEALKHTGGIYGLDPKSVRQVLRRTAMDVEDWVAEHRPEDRYRALPAIYWLWLLAVPSTGEFVRATVGAAKFGSRAAHVASLVGGLLVAGALGLCLLPRLPGCSHDTDRDAAAHPSRAAAEGEPDRRPRVPRVPLSENRHEATAPMINSSPWPDLDADEQEAADPVASLLAMMDEADRMLASAAANATEVDDTITRLIVGLHDAAYAQPERTLSRSAAASARKLRNDLIAKRLRMPDASDAWRQVHANAFSPDTTAFEITNGDHEQGLVGDSAIPLHAFGVPSLDEPFSRIRVHRERYELAQESDVGVIISDGRAVVLSWLPMGVNVLIPIDDTLLVGCVSTPQGIAQRFRRTGLVFALDPESPLGAARHSGYAYADDSGQGAWFYCTRSTGQTLSCWDYMEAFVMTFFPQRVVEGGARVGTVVKVPGNGNGALAVELPSGVIVFAGGMNKLARDSGTRPSFYVAEPLHDDSFAGHAYELIDDSVTKRALGVHRFTPAPDPQDATSPRK